MLLEEEVMLSLVFLLILPETSSATSDMEVDTAFFTPSDKAIAAMVLNPDPLCAFFFRLRFDGEAMGESDDTSVSVPVEMSFFRKLAVACWATCVMDSFSRATRRYS